jgi:hypothetical protein
MEHVVFISTESGDDLIVSFAVAPDLTYPGEIESLTLLWTPKYDHLLPSEERGVGASFERLPDDGLDKNVVAEIRDSVGERTVQVVTARWTYTLDVRKVDTDELKDMRKILGKMSRTGGLRYVRL